MKNDVFSPKELRALARWPHLIGHLVGKTKLTKLHSKWLRELWFPDEHTAIQAHRGAYKTTICTEIGIIYNWLFHPDDRVALIRETWSVANDSLKTIAAYMRTELIQELFRALHDEYPVASTDKDGRLVYTFKGTITKEGSLDAYGVDTVPTGSHYDVILVDDAISIKDRFSRAKRDRTRENLQEIMTNILDPGKHIRVVGTPWHKDDAWKILPKPKKYTCYDTNILTADEIEEKRKGTTKAMFAANYELVHVSGEDMLFVDPEIEPWKKSRGKVVAHLDAAYGGEDTTALTIGQMDEEGGVQLYGKVFTGAAEKCIPEIKRILRRFECRNLIMEDNGDKGFLAKIMREYDADHDNPRDRRVLRTSTYHETQNKHIKIAAYLGHHWDVVRWHPDTDEDYLSQICDYAEGSEPDDAPDSAASLLRQVFFPMESHSASWRAKWA